MTLNLSFFPSSSAPSLEKSFQDQVDNLLYHRAFMHPLFEYLVETVKKGITSEQFQVYRDNYLLRTLQTIPSLIRALFAATSQYDFKTLASVGKNLYEETGEGIAENAHSFLLQDSHNTHGQAVFSLSPIDLQNIEQSPNILPETQAFIREQKALYTSTAYSKVLGAMLGHEMAAEPMLKGFYETIFLPYNGYYPPSMFEKVQKYFLCHLQGTEKRHSEDAYNSALQFCQNEEDVALVIKGATEFLKHQSLLWDGLLQALIHTQSKGRFVEVWPSGNS